MSIFSDIKKFVDDLLFPSKEEDEELHDLMEWAKNQDHETRMELVQEIFDQFKENLSNLFRR